MLAARLGIPVVYDFRAADVAAGGEGAPFSPMYHRALARRLGLEPPVAVLNIGGVANVTYIDGDDLIACDTGPGNALLDDFVRLRIAKPLDTDGHMAQAGRVDREAIARLLRHPFFAKPPPKSLDRNAFRGWVGAAFDSGSVEDGAATLTALTAAAAARIVPLLPRVPKTWIVSGGGARNPTLMRMLAERLAPARVQTADDAGWSIDALEAQAFAYLAVRSLRGLPISLPATTGVPRPLCGGVLAEPYGRPAHFLFLRSHHCIAPGPGIAPGGHLPRMIMPSTSSLVTSADRGGADHRPFFITQIRSARSNTSWMSWLIRKMPMPSALSCLISSPTCAVSCGPSAAVGSSMIRMRALKMDGAGDGDRLALAAGQRLHRILEAPKVAG